LDDNQEYYIHQNTDLTSFLSWADLPSPQPLTVGSTRHLATRVF
jgi:hypothetical protein